MRKILTALTFVLMCSSCLAAGYDGVWFLGFNTNKDVFGDRNGSSVRKAFQYAVDRKYICKEIIRDDNVPTGVIPKGMDGYDGVLKGYPLNLNASASLLKKAGYLKKDKRLSGLMLAHTDGVKTIEIANSIQNDLKKIGVRIELKQIKYSEGEKWEDYLSSGKYHMFLIGYKLLPKPDMPTAEAVSSKRLLFDLFGSAGEANFFFLRDGKVDSSLDAIDSLPTAEAKEITKRLRSLNKYLQELSLTVNLFYIKKIPGLEN
ncbi:MAG: ABC transporter substrate-binding protein [Candidatus Saganbacteria bacterium]|nr:ABC transporter substrate-binding protein [Candidatus Saganbacteria bacterium]